MAKVEIPYCFRAFTEGQATVEMPASSVRESLQLLTERFPRLRLHVFDTQEQLRPFIRVFLHDEDTHYLAGLDTPVDTSAVLKVIAATAGGVVEDLRTEIDSSEEVDVVEYQVKHNHELLTIHTDRESGLRAAIAVHNTSLGPAVGGTRLKFYQTGTAALLDVLKLAEAMTYKAAVAGLPLGGGKAVILADGREGDANIRSARFQEFGRFINRLDGSYITTEDVGTVPADMAQVRTQTPHVLGTPTSDGGSGDPSPMTAFGVVEGLRSVAEDVLGASSLAGMRINVQGMGKVGMAVTTYLVREGAIVVGTDIDRAVMGQAQSTLGIQVCEPEAIYTVPCDIFAPCALGGVINERSIEVLTCRIVAGAANNQLADSRYGEILHERGIVYVVDYVLNAGGLINVAQEMVGYDEAKARAKTAEIYHTIKRMLRMSREEGISTQQAAHRIALDALRGAKAPELITSQKESQR